VQPCRATGIQRYEPRQQASPCFRDPPGCSPAVPVAGGQSQPADGTGHSPGTSRPQRWGRAEDRPGDCARTAGLVRRTAKPPHCSSKERGAQLDRISQAKGGGPQRGCSHLRSTHLPPAPPAPEAGAPGRALPHQHPDAQSLAGTLSPAGIVSSRAGSGWPEGGKAAMVRAGCIPLAASLRLEGSRRGDLHLQGTRRGSNQIGGCSCSVFCYCSGNYPRQVVRSNLRGISGESTAHALLSASRRRLAK